MVINIVITMTKKSLSLLRLSIFWFVQAMLACGLNDLEVSIGEEYSENMLSEDLQYFPSLKY